MPKQHSVVITSALLPLAGVPPPATPPAARRQRHTAGRRPLPHEWRERVGTQHRLRQLWLHLRRAILLHRRLVVTLLLVRRGGVAPRRAVRALRSVAPLRRELLAVLLLRRSAVLLRGRRLVLLRACGVASTSLATKCKCSCSLTHTAQAHTARRLTDHTDGCADTTTLLRQHWRQQTGENISAGSPPYCCGGGPCWYAGCCSGPCW